MWVKSYTVNINGKSTTVRTCNGPIAAYIGLTGEKLQSWTCEPVNGVTIVNGHEVTELSFLAP